MARKKKTFDESEERGKVSSKDKIHSILNRAISKKFLTKSQSNYWDVLDKNEIIFCVGPSGTGKSFIAIRKAIDLLLDKNNQFEKIIIVRPAVEVGRSIGYLPGDLPSKLAAFLSPTYHLLDKIVGKESSIKLREEGYVEILSLNHIRGWTIDNAILICEESQNLLKDELKALITRIGYNSKFFLAGDVEQTDIVKDFKQSGLYDALERFKGMEKIGIFQFLMEDIVRNPLISEILKRY